MARFDAQAEVLDQWGLKRGIAKGDVFQFHQSTQLTLIHLTLVLTMILREFHHILDTFHLTAHHHDGLRGIDDIVDRREERRHEPLEGQEHTHRQFAFQNQQSTEDQDRSIHQSVHKNRHQVHLQLLFCGIAFHIEFLGPETAPVFKEARFSTGSLDALHVVDAGNGR